MMQRFDAFMSALSDAGLKAAVKCSIRTAPGTISRFRFSTPRV